MQIVTVPWQMLEATVIALRESANVHDTERLPHISGGLRALADELERLSTEQA